MAWCEDWMEFCYSNEQDNDDSNVDGVFWLQQRDGVSEARTRVISEGRAKHVILIEWALLQVCIWKGTGVS